MVVGETGQRRGGSQANCYLQSPQKQFQPDATGKLWRGPHAPEFSPLKEKETGLSYPCTPHSVVKGYPREMEIPRCFLPLEVQEKSKDRPPLAEGSKNTLKLVEGSGEHHTEKVQRYPRRFGKSMDIIPYSL